MECNIQSTKERFKTRNAPNPDIENSSSIDGDYQLPVVLKVLSQNEECQRLLEKEEENILNALKECRRELSAVEERLRSIKPSSRPKNHWCLFGMPYFMDEYSFPCPPNSDATVKESLHFLYQSDLTLPHPWRKEDMKTLALCVYESEMQKLNDAIAQKCQFIRKELEECKCNRQIKMLQKELVELEEKKKSFKVLSLDFLVGSSKSEYDWLKISNKDFNGLRTADECRSMWFNYLHPDINKSPWTKSDDELLKSVTVKHNCQDWCAIAYEFGNNRSAYQCMSRFLSVLQDVKGPFSAEENNTLRDLVKRFKIGSYVPWQKVSLLMEGRTQNQIYRHWIFSANPELRKGHFSQQEDIMLVAGIKKFGLKFGSIAKYFPCRTAEQLRGRFHSLSHMLSRPIRWSKKDDVLLLRLIETHGENDWKVICKEFQNCNVKQLQHRYQILKRYLLKNPGKSTPRVISRPLKKPRHLEKIWKDVQNLVIKKKIPHEKVNDKVEVNEKSLRKLSSLLVCQEDKNIDDKFLQYFRFSYSNVNRPSIKNDDSPHLSITSSALQTSQFLNLMHSDLNLRGVSRTFPQEWALSKEDKEILRYLAGNKSLLGPSNPEQNVSQHFNCEVNASQTSRELVAPSSSLESNPIGGDLFSHGVDVQFSGSPSQSLNQFSNEERIIYRCPPNFTTMVGLRTVLHHSRKIEERVKYKCKEKSKYEVSQMSDKGRKAVDLFKKRFGALFSFPAIMSNKYPSPPLDLFSEDDCVASKIDHFVQINVASERSTQMEIRLGSEKSPDSFGTTEPLFVSENDQSMVIPSSSKSPSRNSEVNSTELVQKNIDYASDESGTNIQIKFRFDTSSLADMFATIEPLHMPKNDPPVVTCDSLSLIRRFEQNNQNPVEKRVNHTVQMSDQSERSLGQSSKTIVSRKRLHAPVSKSSNPILSPLKQSKQKNKKLGGKDISYEMQLDDNSELLCVPMNKPSSSSLLPSKQSKQKKREPARKSLTYALQKGELLERRQVRLVQPSETAVSSKPLCAPVNKPSVAVERDPKLRKIVRTTQSSEPPVSIGPRGPKVKKPFFYPSFSMPSESLVSIGPQGPILNKPFFFPSHSVPHRRIKKRIKSSKMWKKLPEKPDYDSQMKDLSDCVCQ